VPLPEFWSSKEDPDWQALSEWLRGGSVGLDYAYFRERIQRIVTKQYRASNNQSCMSCHQEGNSRAADFKLLAPSGGDAVRRNYETVLLFITPGDPDGSAFLTEPYNTTQRNIREVQDQEIIRRYVRGTGHDGGKFWWELTDPDFQVIYEWIGGARLLPLTTSVSAAAK